MKVETRKPALHGSGLCPKRWHSTRTVLPDGCPCLSNARLRCGERGVAGQRSLHQPRQLGIAEQQPPLSDNRIRCAHIAASAHKASARVC